MDSNDHTNMILKIKILFYASIQILKTKNLDKTAFFVT